MKYDRFEDLPVWQAAADLAAQMFLWTSRLKLRGKGDLADQLQRAALSISNNIAEGFERGTTNELLTFLYYARGSAGEVRSMLCVMERMITFDRQQANQSKYDDWPSQIVDFKSQCESISRQLRAWAGSLQNSDIAGQRHLNDKTRQEYERAKKRQTFVDKQRQFMAQKAAELREAAQECHGPRDEH